MNSFPSSRLVASRIKPERLGVIPYSSDDVSEEAPPAPELPPAPESEATEETSVVDTIPTPDFSDIPEVSTESKRTGDEPSDLAKNMELVYDLFRTGHNIYRIFQGDDPIQYDSDVFVKPPKDPAKAGTVDGNNAPASSNVDAAVKSISQAAQRARSAFNSSTGVGLTPTQQPVSYQPQQPVSYQPQQPPVATTPVALQPIYAGPTAEAAPVDGPVTVGSSINPPMPGDDPAEIRARGYGVYTDGSGRLTGYVTPEGQTVQFYQN